MSAEVGSRFTNVDWIGGRLKLDSSTRFGFLGQWYHFRETMIDRSDETGLGDFNLTFRILESPRFYAYTGAGIRVLSDRQQTDTGWNLTIGGEWFPKKPFVVSGSFDLGKLGNADVTRFRISAGALIGRLECYVGYDHWTIERTRLNGPILGIRSWF